MSIYNFSPGPAMLPAAVKQRIADELPDWRNTGVSVMEVSHRGAEFRQLVDETEALLRELLALPENYRILFMPGGARQQYSMVPMNFARPDQQAVYFVQGHWGKDAIREATKFCRAEPLMPYSAEQPYAEIPAHHFEAVTPQTAYFHYTPNETLEGIEWHDYPAVPHAVPVIADMTSNLLSRPLDMSRFGAIYGSAQKNLGIAGITLGIVREDLLDRAPDGLPLMLDYRTYANSQSLHNTPPTFPWYVANLVLHWLKQQGGLAAMEQRNIEKSSRLYDFIDSSDFYRNNVRPEHRSRMNVTFWLTDESLNDAFLQESREAGLLALKGHRFVGGMRASLYNAMPLQGVLALIDFMRDFERRHG